MIVDGVDSPAGSAMQGGQDGSLGVRALAFNTLGAAAAVLDRSGVILETNESWRLFASLNGGTVAATGAGVNYLEVCDRAAAAGSPFAAAVAGGLREILAGDRTHLDLEYPCASPIEDRWCLLQASSAPVADGGGVVMFHVDVTARVLMTGNPSRRLEDDVMTGLATRAWAVRRLEQHLIVSRRTGSDLWLMTLHLGHGDRVNCVDGGHGHHVDDELLVKVVLRATRTLRAADRLCRIGNDELIVICPGLGAAGAVALAQRLRAVMGEPFQIGARVVSGGVSIGFVSSGPSSTVESLMHLVDASMRATADPATSPGDHERTEISAQLRPVDASVPVQPVVEVLPPRRPDVRNADDPVAELAAVRALVEAGDAKSSEVVMLFEMDGTIHSASRAARHLFGVEPDALVGSNGLELIHPDDQERVFLDFASVPLLGDHVRTRFRVFDAAGEVRWLEEDVTNLVDDPQIGFIVANIRDVHDQVQAEEAVRFQARVLGAVGQAVVATDMVGVITYWNLAAQDLFGWTATEVLGRPITRVVPTAPRSMGDAADIIRSVAAGGSWTGELWVNDKAGELIPITMTSTPVHDGSGARVGTIGVSTDISARLRSDEATAMLSVIVESSHDAIFSVDPGGLITTWNGGASTLFGFPRIEMIGTPITALLPHGPTGREPATLAVEDAGRGIDGEPVARLAELFERSLHGEPIDATDTLARRSDGSTVQVAISIAPIRSTTGEVVGTCAIARDVTERVELLRTIEADRRRLAVAQASARLGSFELDLDTDVLTRSTELCRILGIEPTDDTTPALQNVHEQDRHLMAALIDAAIAGDATGECTYRIVRPDGEVRWVLSNAERSSLPGSNIVAGTVLDVTDRHRIESVLAHQATHDWLTGLPNSASLQTTLLDALAAAHGTRHVAVAVLDLDHFKVINDGGGHATGDRVLRVVAERLRDGLGPHDVIVRAGGDEFVLVRVGAQTLEDAQALADEALALVAGPVRIDGHELWISASIGVTLSTPGDSPEVLLRNADDAMYAAKRDGRGQVVVFDQSSRARNDRRQQVTDALAYALELGQFHLEFQPVVSISTLDVAGFEALVRWEHPVLGHISPDEFIPIAESSAMILHIGSWVLDRSVDQLATWLADPRIRPDLWMAINVSAPQLAQPRFAARVAAAIAAARVPAASVHLEITESVLMDRIDNAVRTVTELQATGVRLSIDDFGTGYSSLSYLSRLPVDTIKIDRSFISGLGGPGHETSIVRATIALADTLGLDVVAEGVELPHQVELLRDLGCRYGQGFLWSRPLAVAPAEAWLLKRSVEPDAPDTTALARPA